MRDGLVVVDKPAGWTSHDVVARLRGAYHQRRIGHAGTLDPDATGVLLVGLGQATRLLRFLQDAGKSYRGVVVFGIETSTLDAAGDEVRRVDMTPTREQVERAARGFVGEIDQVPPMVSAIKVGGQRLHALARRGEEVVRAPRRVRVDRFDVEDLGPGPYPRSTVRVACSSGTYVRSLAADLGAALGGCAHLGSLRRESVGSFTLAEAHPLDEVLVRPDACVLPLLEAVRDLPRVEVDDDTARRVRHGAPLGTGVHAQPGASDAPLPPGPVAVVGPGSVLLGVYEAGPECLRPLVVLVAPPA